MPQESEKLCLKACRSETLDRAKWLWSLTSLPVPVIPKVLQVLAFSESFGPTWQLASLIRSPALTDLAQASAKEHLHLRASTRAALVVCASIRRRVVEMAALSETFLSLDTTTPSPPQSRRSNP